MCGECIAHLRPPPPWRPQVPAPQPLTAWARNPGAGDQRRLGMGASICLGPPPRGFQGPSLPPLAPPPSGCPGEVSGRGYPTLVSDPQRGRNWCCHRPGPSQHKGIRAPCPVRKAPPPPCRPQRLPRSSSRASRARGVQPGSLRPPKRGDPTCTLRLVSGPAPGALGRACLFSSRPKMNFLAPEGLIPYCRLFAGKSSQRGTGKKQHLTAEPWAKSGRGSPGMGAPASGIPRRLGAVGPGCGTVGRAARPCAHIYTSAIPYCPGWAAASGWREGRELRLGQKVTVTFFFFP